MDVGRVQSLQGIRPDPATIVEDINASRYLTYATFCLLVYDHGMCDLQLPRCFVRSSELTPYVRLSRDSAHIQR